MINSQHNDTKASEATQDLSPREMEAVSGGNSHILVAMQIAKMYAAKPSLFELKPFGK